MKRDSEDKKEKQRKYRTMRGKNRMKREINQGSKVQQGGEINGGNDLHLRRLTGCRGVSHVPVGGLRECVEHLRSPDGG